MTTATAAGAAAAAAAAKAAKNKSAAAEAPPATGDAKKPGRKPKLDADGKPVPRPPAKPISERLAALKQKLAEFDVKAAKDRADLEAKIAGLEAKAAPKVATKDDVIAAAPTLGKTPAQIAANVAKEIARLRAIAKAATEMTDEDFAEAEQPADGDDTEPESEDDTDEQEGDGSEPEAE